jgi:hypothetical protein
MQNAIIDKLARHLSAPIDTECKVVYLLCEVRKILDRKTAPLGLLMYADWAVHVTLDRNPGAEQLLGEVDQLVAQYLRQGSPAPRRRTATEKELVFIGSFREELRAFLASFGLPTDLCDDHERWFKFVTAYAGVIEDGDLIYKAKKGLRYVKRLIFTKGKQTTDEDADLPFIINWKIELLDSRMLYASLTSWTSGGSVSWGMRLSFTPPEMIKEGEVMMFRIRKP